MASRLLEPASAHRDLDRPPDVLQPLPVPPRGGRRVIRGLLRGAGLVVALLAAYLLFWPVPIDPFAWTPPANPGLTGPYVANDDLARAEMLDVSLGEGSGGPESVARGPHDGLLYTGLRDGWIVRLDPRSARVERFADTGGRPLGLAFDPDGELYVADARKGILRITPEAVVTTIADCGDGKVPGYTDSLARAADGTLWFTCPSRRWSLEDIRLDGMETRPTGRLMRHDPRTGETRTELDGLMFANGVVLAPDERFVLVNEWYGYRITRLWLAGPKRGERDVFFDALPGYPDNLALDRDGILWVGLVIPRDATLDRLLPHPFLRKILPRIPASLQPQAPVFAWLIGIDPAGRVVHNLQDGSGRFDQVTGALALDGMLYVTSNATRTLARLPAPPLDRTLLPATGGTR